MQCLFRGAIARKSVTKLRKRLKYRKHIINELVVTEKNYINKLQLMIDVIKKPLLQAIKDGDEIITESQIKTIFSETE
jgi:hypothetical protein